MKLIDQVVGFDLAQQLKKLGVKQDSYFSYVTSYGGGIYLDRTPVENKTQQEWITASAFTVAELGNIFPVHIQLPFKDIDCWKWSSEKGRHVSVNEANARAKMLVYLLENKIIVL